MSLEQAQTAVRTARETVASLIDRRAVLEERSSQLDSEREEVALSAFEGNKAAQKRLDQVNAETIKYETECKSIEAALRVAQGRLASAESDENRAREADNAVRALALIDTLRADALALDEAAVLLLSKYEALKDTARALRGLGALARPTQELMKVASRRALDTHLQFSDLRGEFLAPSERRTYSDLAATWCSGVEAWATPRLCADDFNERLKQELGQAAD
jgi:hypothetical protein